MKATITVEVRKKRFESYLVKQPNDCWLWSGCQNDSGFGQFGVYDQSTGTVKIKIAHRYAYEQHIGRELLRSEQTTHSCGDKLCCNPEHIEMKQKKYVRVIERDVTIKRI